MASRRSPSIVRSTIRRNDGLDTKSNRKPLWVRALLSADVQPTLLLNPFIAPHLTSLMDLIRTRAIVQYIQPFSSVDLATMSNSLGISQDMLLMEIEQLVEKGKINGRIDLIDKVCPASSCKDDES